MDNFSNSYKYNGKEWQDELSLNMYDMDMRQYDPAIARWVVQDPVVHFDYSPYSAFDNNPVFWADPSGADSERDYMGRDRFDSYGRYIAPNDRGEANFDSGMNGSGSNSGGGDSKWSPLTSEQFKNYVKEKYGVADNQLADFAGKLFENAFIKFGEVNFEKEANFEGVAGRSTLSRPDAYSDGAHFNFTRVKYVRYSKSVWWEVKARNKNVTLDKQIKGFIDSIASEFQYTATKTGAAYLSLVTTSNSNVNPEVYTYAKSKGVQIQHWQAQYKMVNGNMLLDFGYKTGPLNPTIYEFKTPVKL